MRLFVLRLLAGFFVEIFAQGTVVVKVTDVLGQLVFGSADKEDGGVVRDGSLNDGVDLCTDIAEAYIELADFAGVRIPFLYLICTADDDVSGIILDGRVGHIINLAVFVVFVDVIEHAAGCNTGGCAIVAECDQIQRKNTGVGNARQMLKDDIDGCIELPEHLIDAVFLT